MGEILTYRRDQVRTPRIGCCMGDIETREDLSLVSGRVLFHGPDRDEVLQSLEFKSTDSPFDTWAHGPMTWSSSYDQPNLQRQERPGFHRGRDDGAARQ